MNQTHQRNQSERRTKTSVEKAIDPDTTVLTISDQDLYEQVARKAYELYQQRGEAPGHDLEDWFIAERLVHAELLHGPVSEPPIEEEEYPGEEDLVRT
jgi:hypothetical protein